jgi:16S rRNA (cytosine967-C5)-methyltransferase
MRTLPRAETASEVARHDLIQPPIIVTSVAGTDDSHFTPHEEPGFFVFHGSPDDLYLLLDAHRAARVQDPASARPVTTTRELRPRLIIDACAGKGTKTKQLAALHPDARIIAADVDERRHRVLRQTFSETEQVTVKRFDDLRAHRGQADLLLLDVPCSNTGVLARRVEARYRLSAKTLQSLVDLQRSIVATTLPLLGAEGRLLYATCSLEPEENEQQIDWLKATHRMEASGTTSLLPQGQPGDPPARYRDGGFSVLLARRQVQ